MHSVLVTGANSGIGRATAARLAAAGYRVVAGMRDTKKAEKLVEIVRAAGKEVEPLELDVCNEDSVRAAFARAGQVDILINNAGIGWNAATEDIDIESAKLAFETNYWGVIRCIKAVLPQMRERGSGQIVNVSSIAGRIAAIGQTVYSSSKWALEGLSENLAQEVEAFGVRVSVIEPGVTRTAILPKNIDHPTPTAYDTAYRRMMQFYAKGIQAAVPAEEVAETIHKVLENEGAPFRTTCAWGGEQLPAGRRNMSDADWIRLGAISDDDAYYKEFERLFGLEIRP